MLVLKRSETGYKQDPTKYFNFTRYSNDVGNIVLVEGAFEESNQWGQFHLSPEQMKHILSKDNIYRIELEEPNKFFIADKMESYDHYFKKILTICPYTAEWKNKKIHTEQRIPIFFPFNEEYVPPKKDKIFDIIYTGHLNTPSIERDTKIMSKFKYCFVSNSNSSLVTHKSVSYEEKMSLISQSRITLTHNALSPKIFHLPNIWKTKDIYSNMAFKLVPKWYEFWKLFNLGDVVVPQIKSRVFEAAFARSLILCKKDPFNVIERFFVPDKEFIYYTDNNLENTITDVLKNYSRYQPIIDRAFNKAMREYTTSSFVSKFLMEQK